MRIIIIILLACFISRSFSQAPSRQELQQQLGGPLKELTDRIAELEKQIAEEDELNERIGNNLSKIIINEKV